MRDLSELTAADFEPLEGTEFQVRDADAPATVLVLHLVEVVRLPERPGHRQPFTLHFLGPVSPVLDYIVHHLSHPLMGEMELFLGPVLANGPGTTYEAVFT